MTIEYWAGYMPRVGDTVKVIAEATFINDAQTWRVMATSPGSQQARICLSEPGKRDVITVVDWKDLQHAPELDQHTIEVLEQKEGQLRRLGDENERLRRINETTGQNLTKARRKRRDADERALALGRFTAELQDQLTARKERIELLESTKEVDSHAIERLQKQRSEDSIRIKELQAALRGMENHRDDAVARLNRQVDESNKLFENQNTKIKMLETANRTYEQRNVDLINEVRGCNEMIKRQRQQIDDLVNERPTEHIGPNKDVSWEEAWRPQLGEGEELTLKTLIGQALGAASMCWTSTPNGIFWSEKAEWIMGGVINQIEKLQWREQEHPSTMRECNNDTFDPESEVPYPLSTETQQQYHKRLHKWLQGMIEHIKVEARDAIYPGWKASNYQTKEEFFDGESAKDCGWSVAQNLAEKTKR